MKIIKLNNEEIKTESAHDGSGSRKVLAMSEFMDSDNLEAMTHGWLPAGSVFDWHSHEGLDEIMYVLVGSGKVSDGEGTYDYEQGDVFIFPADEDHKIENTSGIESEMIFVRVRV